MKKILLLIIVAILIFTGCGMNFSSLNEEPEENELGTLELILNSSSVKSKTLEPEIEMVVSTYDITGFGPDSNTFEELGVSAAGGDININSLVPGTWLINVNAKNPSGDIIADGSIGGVEITAGKKTEASITVSPLDGQGTFDLTVSWDPADFPDGTPDVTATLTPSGGSAQQLNFTINDENSVIHSSLLDKGYYDLDVMADNGFSTASFYDSVRIITDQTTRAELDISPQDVGLIITIINDLENPIEINFSGVVDPLVIGNNMTVNATTYPSPVDTYQWRLDYVILDGETSPSVTFGSALSLGTHILTLRVTLDSIISSESIIFEVVESMTYSSIIMIYLDGDNNLESAAIDDINEMEAVDLTSSDIKVIVLVDRIPGYDTSNGNWSNTRLYEIDYDSNGYDTTIVSTRIAGMGLTTTGTEELNMGNPATLTDFVDFCKASYPANNYSLMLWNHGGGWRSIREYELIKAVCWDDTNGGDCLYTSEVKSAIIGKGISLIGFDACLMAMAEVAYELRNCADIMVASEEVEPGDGWDYVELLEQYKTSDLSMNALSQAIVDSYASFYSTSSTTLSALDLTNLNSLITALNTFSTDLQSIDLATINTAKNNTQDFYVSDYIDLYDFADQFALTSASNVKTAISNIVLYNWSHFSLNGYGISIYYPSGGIDPDYLTEIEFSTDTNWDEFLSYANNVTPDSYEDDDTYSDAKVITSGETQLHNFDIAGDNDWMQITVSAGDNYVFETSQAGSSSTDTYMCLYNTDGTTILANDDDGGSGYYSLINYTFATAGTYYIMVRPYSTSTSYIGDQYNITATLGTPPVLNDAGDFIVNQINYVTSGDLSVDILIYENGEYNYAVSALNSLGASYTQAFDQSTFQSYSDQTWDLIIFYEYGTSIQSGSYTFLENHVQNGKKLIFFYWDVDSELTQPLYELIGIDTSFSATEITNIQTENVFSWQSSHPIFNTPNSISLPFSFQEVGYNDDGDKVYVNTSGTALAGFTSTTTSGNCAIIESNSSNVLLNTFPFDCIQGSLYRDNIRKEDMKNK